jgi:poly-beta-1,6-N-acetyl-D-glucosamine synthase
MIELLANLGASYLHDFIVYFLAGFPIVIASLAINSSRQYSLDRSRCETERYFPHQKERRLAHRRWPLVSVVIPARNESEFLAQTIRAALNLQWPEIEIIVINDGSTDATQEIIDQFQIELRLTVIKHESPRGKSISLNEGLAIANSELVLILDADSVPAKNVLNRMVPHMIISSDIAAVTGNPRVCNLPNILAKLQAIEFSSTISTLRRGQSAWGRVNTVSGIMTVFRKSLIQNLGGFADDQPTEDIELTWRLHRAGYRCIYEPAAQVSMMVPPSFALWLKQRKRWSAGLVRVLQRHGFAILRKKEWPTYPILFEAFLAIIWCHLLVFMTIVWFISLFHEHVEIGNSVLIGSWGSMAIAIAIGQIYWGMHLDSRYDKRIKDLFILAPIYPIIYWMLSAFVVTLTTIPTLISKPKPISWQSPRPQNVPRS